MAGHTRVAPIYEYTPLRINAAGVLVPVGLCVSTTSATSIAAGSNVVVTPASMAGITSGMMLNIANGVGTPEDVLVKSITSTTFTADFLNRHVGAYTIISRRGIFLNKVTVNDPGSNSILALYNGHPSIFPDAGGAFVAFNPSNPDGDYECILNKGLFYTLTVYSGGITPDLTLFYADMAE